MQGGIWRLAGGYAVVEMLHQFGGGCIADIPQRANDIVRTSAKKSPCKPDQSFAGIGAHARALACGDGHQIRVAGACLRCHARRASQYLAYFPAQRG